MVFSNYLFIDLDNYKLIMLISLIIKDEYFDHSIFVFATNLLLIQILIFNIIWIIFFLIILATHFVDIEINNFLIL